MTNRLYPPPDAAGLLAAALRNGPQAGDRVLSVQQPHAGLLVTGHKPVENRSWDTKFRGVLWIHASQRPDDADRDYLLDSLVPEPVVAAWEDKDGPQWQTSAIVGAVWVQDVYSFQDLPPQLTGLTHASGPVCFWCPLSGVLETPVPCGGKLNLWTFQAEPAKARRKAS